MPSPKTRKSTNDRDIHVRLSHDDYVALTKKAKEETRSMTAQALFYIRRGIAQDAKQ